MQLSETERFEYSVAEHNEKYRVASTSPAKRAVISALVARHTGERVLVIGQYLEQLHELGEHLDAPVITGQMPVKERERLFEAFRTGETRVLVVSKVANFSVDLPEAGVAIQVFL
mgnify:CR=1 FL=1